VESDEIFNCLQPTDLQFVCIHERDRSCFCFYFLNVKKFDNAAGTKPKSEIKQTNISANMEIKIQKLRLQELYQANKMQTRKEINCNDVLRDQTTYSSTSL
jgi:hypothetical protein